MFKKKTMKGWLSIFLSFVMLVSMMSVLTPAIPAAAATTSVTVNKYDPYGNLLGTQTITWEEMMTTLPVYGDGVTHYYMHGPTFDDSSFDLLWDTVEMVNIDSRDYGAAMGTDLKDLCDLVDGGAGSGDTIQVKAQDNFSKWFDYEDVYDPEPEQGKMVVTWYTTGTAEGDEGFVDDTYGDGMRLIFFPETVNPEGKHVFGIWDMHETLPASRWHYYTDGSYWPSSSGLSAKIVDEVNIHQPNLVSCDASGNPVDSFEAGETVYVKGMGLAASTDYNIWIQDEPVLKSPLNELDRPSGSYIFDAGNDPSGAQEPVTTDGNGDFGPEPIWTIDPSASSGEYDIAADSQASGTVGTYETTGDYIDNPGWEGFGVTAGAEPVAPVADFSADVTSGDAPLTVNFTDLSTNSPTEWEWDFDNDGSVDSYDQNPSFTYDNTGTYSVKLTATNAYGSDDKVEENYITVTEATSPGPGLADSPWPTAFQNNHRTGLSPYNGPLTEPEVKWTLDNNMYLVSGPRIGPDGTVYAVTYVTGENASLNAVDPADGSIKWSTELGNGNVKGPSIASDGTIYIMARYHVDEYLMALDPDDGAIIWTANPTDIALSRSAPTIGPDGTIYVVPVDAMASDIYTSGAYAYNPDGTLKWQIGPGDSWLGSRWSAGAAVGDDGTVYFAGVVYLAGVQDHAAVRAINPDGSEKWEFIADAPYLQFDSLAIGPGGTIYALARDEDWTQYCVYAINPADGSSEWSIPLADFGQGKILVGPDETLYVAGTNPDWDGGWLYALNPDGSEQWTIAWPGGVMGALVGADGTIYMAGFSADWTSGTFYALDPSDGSEIWSYSLPGRGYADEWFEGLVLDSDGTLYAATMDLETWDSAYLYAFEAAAPVPVADFSADVTSGDAPLTVNFTDLSTNSPTEWEWDFDNDGTVDSYDQNPSYTYNSGGTYSVKLTVTNDDGSDTTVKTDYISVLAILWGPYLTGTTETETVINVKTSLPTDVTVEYATEADYTGSGSYDQSASDGLTTELHHISLTGLELGATYHYRVLYDTEATGDYSFTTFPESGTFTFAVYSDSQDQLPLFSQEERHKLVADAIAGEEDVLFVLHAGDLVNDGEDTENWDRFFDAARDMLAGTTIYPALGNHDNHSPLYYEAFGVTPYYSFECADAYFAMLDSDDLSAVTEQATWLSSDIASDKQWKFATFHHPMYTSETDHFGGWAGVFSEWQDIFVSGGVDAVWNGHIHTYERYLNNGTMYTVIGTGGGPSDILSETKYDGYQNSLEHSLVYAKVTIDPEADTATVEIIRVADVSTDNTEVTTVYPAGTVFESYVLTHPSISASAGASGTIDPSGEVAVRYGNDQTFTITPDEGCEIADVLVDGVSVGAVDSYTFTSVTEDHSIEASFSILMESFSVNQLIVDYNQQEDRDTLMMNADFELPDSVTFDYMNDDVTFDIGGYIIDIPAGSFRKQGWGRSQTYTCNIKYSDHPDWFRSRWGWFGSPFNQFPQSSQKLTVTINIRKGEVSVSVRNADVSVIDSSAPVNVEFRIGSAVGQQEINLFIERAAYNTE